MYTFPAVDRSLRFRDLAVEERPQERLEKFGGQALNDVELLAMLLRSGSQDFDVLEMSTKLLEEAGALGDLLGWSVEDFEEIKGIGRVKALQLFTAFELARRVLSEKQGSNPVLKTPDKVFDFMVPIVAGLKVEKFWMLCLNAKNKLLKRVEVTSGLLDASLVHPREAFRDAIRVGAASAIAVHNHPSGDPTPSRADIEVTHVLQRAGNVLNIKLYDHVIIGYCWPDPMEIPYMSFMEEGLLV